MHAGPTSLTAGCWPMILASAAHHKMEGRGSEGSKSEMVPMPAHGMHSYLYARL